MQIWGIGERILTDVDQLRRNAVILWFVQGDAAAKDEDDGVLRSGGGARVAESRKRRKTMERGENGKRLVVAIYKGKANKWA